MLQKRTAAQQPIAHFQHGPLALRQLFQRRAHLLHIHAANGRILHHIPRRAQDILEGDIVAFTVHADGIGQGHVVSALLGRTQLHQHLIFNAAGGIGGQRRFCIGLIGIHRLDQPQRAHRHQIVLRQAGHGIFAHHMGNQA